LPAIIIALTLHEFGHAAMATKLGDPTARLQGRLTLNPLAHLDPLGTLFIIFTAFSGFVFGWAKPVPFNPSYFSNYRNGRILVAIAGPAMNLAQAMFAVGVAYVLFLSNAALPIELKHFLVYFVEINIVLMIFNLFPVPPLDGGHVAEMLVPWQYRKQWSRIAPYGLLIILGLVWLTPLFGILINGFFQGMARLLALGFGPEFVQYLFT
jgi:Zn-dependent protease